MVATNPASFGTTTFSEFIEVELPSPQDPTENIAVLRATGEWRPPERLAENLPEDFAIPLHCYVDNHGTRRIVPACSWEELIDLGAVGGLAVLHGINGFDPEVDFAYRSMFLIHQHVRGREVLGWRGMKEHLTRSFHYSRDLFVRRLSRTSVDQRNVLPCELRMDNREQRQPVAALIEKGRAAARAEGFVNPTNEHAVRFGLFLQARENPLQQETEGVSKLIRMSLFDVEDASATPTPEVIGLVEERLLKAIYDHLPDENEEFYSWFLGRQNSLVKQISKQKQHGGQISREEVRGALLELAWRAYRYVGDCLHALMRTIKNSLTEVLDCRERQLYEQMHESQPQYGDLPAALLAERMPFLREAVLAIWSEPGDDNLVAVLHRMLAYYAEMAPQRRAADRQAKAQSELDPECSVESTNSNISDIALADSKPSDYSTRDGPEEVRRGGSSRLSDTWSYPANPDANAFREIAEHIREMNHMECDCGCVDWESQLLCSPDDAELEIGFHCPCGSQQTYRICREAFTRIAALILECTIPGPSG